MNLKRFLLIPTLLVTGLFSFVSCGEDRWPEYEPFTALDNWMYNVMQENYLWYEQLPSIDDVNLFSKPETFLSKVKANQDRYSFVDTTLIAPLESYGFDYTLVRNTDIDTAYNALITYVIPDSPAEKAGLKRGNWIMKVDTSYISKKYEKALLQGKEARTLTMGVWKEVVPEVEAGEEQPEPVFKVVADGRKLALEAATILEDQPLHAQKILNLSCGKVGYLMYRRFEAGNAQDPEKYLNQLRKWSATLAQENIHKVILDLRYNDGGTFDCLQLLGTILVPSYYLREPMCFLEYNNKQAHKNATLTFDDALLKEGKNLDLNTLVVLISNETAGMPEMLLNSLNGKVQKIYAIGTPTKGQNVATERFVNETYRWSINPVVCTVFNGEHQTFEAGFAPTYSVSASNNYATFLPFGDPEETLLKVAVGVLEGTYPPATEQPEK